MKNFVVFSDGEKFENEFCSDRTGSFVEVRYDREDLDINKDQSIASGYSPCKNKAHEDGTVR